MLTPRLVRILFAVALAVQVGVLLITYTVQDRMKQESRAVRDANITLQYLGEVMSAMMDAETAYRGYLLTHDSLFLDPYHNSESIATSRADTIVVRSHTPEQQVSAEWLDRMVDRQYLLIRTILDEDHQRQRPTVVRERLIESRTNMDQIRAIVARMAKEQERAMLYREEEERSLGALTPRVLLLYGLVAIAATSLLFVRLMLEMRSLEKAKETVRVQVQQLETEAVERERAERSLKRVLDSSISGITAFRAVRDEKGSISDFELTLVNHRAEEILGRKAEDLLGKRLLNEFPEVAADGGLARYSKVVETGESLHFEQQRRMVDGDHWLDVIAVRLMDGFVVTFTDVSAMKTQQELGQEKDRLALTGKIARTVAHEVRNPLTNVKLALEQLREEPLPEEGDATLYLDIIQRNADRISGLITEMLESSKPRSLTLEPCRPHMLLNDVADLVRDRIGLQRMRLEVVAAEDLPAIEVDLAQARLALLNITVNAIEAMKPGEGVLKLSANVDGGTVIMRIADNGKGIPKERIGELFEPFVTGHDGGMGLGLTTARSILNSHTVHIGVESEEGVGTTFVLRFPLRAVSGS
ncbi:MAG: ATP-binding protein [Flavobacteriales bacterium]